MLSNVRFGYFLNTRCYNAQKKATHSGKCVAFFIKMGMDLKQSSAVKLFGRNYLNK